MKVLYISAKYGLHDFRFLEKLKNDYELLFLHYASEEHLKEIDEIKDLKTIGIKPLIRSFPAAGGLRQFKKIYDDFKPDVIHSGYVWQVGILPAHYDLHPHLSMVWGSDVLIEPESSIIKRYIVRKVMRQADHIQCDNSVVKNKIINDYHVAENNITVFPWGIDLNLFHPMDKDVCRKKLNLDKEKFILLFPRALENVYDIPTLLNGFELFSRDKNNVLLVIANNGSQRNYVFDFIKEHNLSNKVKVTGWLKNEDIPTWFNAADIYVSIALSDGTPLSLLEAMACGLGLIVSDIPAVNEWIFEANGLKIPTKNPEKLANAMENYYNDRSLINSHGKNSIEIANQRADWNKNYEKLREIYNKITKK